MNKSTVEFKIEKRVPPPQPYNKYPFASMSVGDSFAFPAEVLDRVRTAAYSYAMYHGVKFRVSGPQLRVWRIK